MQETQQILSHGTIVHGRYIVEDLLGKGGFGAVYLVRDQRVESNRFALKEVIDPNTRTRKNFIVECELLRRLDHPALPRFYGIFEGDQDARIYLLMDYVAGQNLEILRLHQHKKRFSLARALRLMEPVVAAVSYIHGCKPPIIHRDIKPANIIVSSVRDDTVLVDFGIAKEYNQDATTTAVRRLSPHYSAPEQYTSGTNLSTDIYGLAATLYVMLSGVIPVDAFQRVIQLRTKGIDPLEPLRKRMPQLAPEVSTVIERAMAIHAEDRFVSVQEFWLALRDAASGIKATPVETSVVPLVPLLEQQISESSTSQPADDIAASETAPATTAILMAPAVIAETTNIFNHQNAAATETALPPLPKESAPINHVRSRRLMFLFLGIVVLLVLIASLFYITDEPLLKGWGLPGSGVSQHSRPTQISHMSTSTPHATATPTQPTKPSPPSTIAQKPISTAIPLVSTSTYAGSAYDQSANINADLTFTNVQQQGATFKGRLMFSNGLTGEANFTSTITADKNVRFIVTPYTQFAPLLFEGKLNADGSMSGTYCSERNNSCDYTIGGYGTWKIVPK